MKLSEDCVRDILIFCKKNIDYKTLKDNTFQIIPVSLKQLFESKLKDKYELKCIMYTVMKLEEVQFIKISNRVPENKSYINSCLINEITYTGHKFIDTTEPEPIWNKTKNAVNKIGNHTLGFVESVAHDAAVEYAKAIAFKQ